MKRFSGSTILWVVILTVLIGNGYADVQRSSLDAEAYYTQGLAYSDKGMYDQAITDCTKAIEIDPKLPGTYNNRGVAYFFKGEYEKAWEDVHKAQNLGYQVHPGFLKALQDASDSDIEK